MPYLASLGVPIIVSIAGRTHDEFVQMTARLNDIAGRTYDLSGAVDNDIGAGMAALDRAATGDFNENRIDHNAELLR